MNVLELKNLRRRRRRFHIRKKLAGTAAKPRISVYKSNRHMYVQAIDDETGRTIAAASSLEKGSGLKQSVDDAGKLGELMGQRLAGKKIQRAVFDRNGYPYHGIVRSIADGIRKAGIQF